MTKEFGEREETTLITNDVSFYTQTSEWSFLLNISYFIIFFPPISSFDFRYFRYQSMQGLQSRTVVVVSKAPSDSWMAPFSKWHTLLTAQLAMRWQEKKTCLPTTSAILVSYSFLHSHSMSDDGRRTKWIARFFSSCASRVPSGPSWSMIPSAADVSLRLRYRGGVAAFRPNKSV